MSNVVKGKHDNVNKYWIGAFVIWLFFIGVFIVGAKRTPFGTYGGKFVKTSASELQTIAAKAALTAANVKPELVDTVVVGNVLSVSATWKTRIYLNSIK